MSSISSFNHNRQRRAAIYALKNLLLYESNNDKTDLLSLLYQLNIETDSIECNDQKSILSSSSHTNYNNSSGPIKIDNLSSSFYLSHSHMQSTRLQNGSLSEQRRRNSSNNSSRKSRSRRRRKQKRLRSNRNKQSETENFHYRNMITVRRISCHDILDSQRKRFEYQENKFENVKVKNERNKKTRSTNLIENKSQKYQTYSTGYKSPPPMIKLHTSSTPFISKKSIVFPTSTNIQTKILTKSISNSLFQTQDIKKNISNTPNMTESKVTSLHDLSVGSLTSTQLLTTVYDQIKPDVTITTSTTPDSENNFESLANHSPHRSTTTSSIVPHFSSTMATYVPYHNSSTTSPMPNTQTVSTSPNENIEDLVDQLKTCINMLSLLLENKTEHDVKSYSDKKRINRKTQQPQSSLSSSSIKDHSKLSKISISNKNNLICEDITVRRCNSPIDPIRKRYQSHIPNLFNNHHDKLKRCLLVYCRNRGRNINSNEKQRNSHYNWKHSVFNKYVSLSQSSESLPNNNDKDILSISRSTLILAEAEEDDDDDETLNKLLRVSSL